MKLGMRNYIIGFSNRNQRECAEGALSEPKRLEQSLFCLGA